VTRRFPACSLLLASLTCTLFFLAETPIAAAQAAARPTVPGKKHAPADLAAVFREGEEALHAGDLDRAEGSFRRVLAADPASAAAYANLGVVAMRRQHWEEAIRLLSKAAKLAPKISGIRLDIGLAYYRQNRFDAAIPPLESVLRDQSSSGQSLSGQSLSGQPASSQARYLLGLCYFFTGRYTDAAHTLEFLWPEQASNLAYLYVLGVAAQHAKIPDLEKRALTHMVDIGQSSAQFHLFMGKAHLNREENVEAVAELSRAAELDPKLPFVHFDLGVAYLKQQDYERAKAEFLKDIALEPDIPFSYDQLGLLFFQAGNDSDAEHSYQEALRRDPNFLSAHLGLARAHQRQGKYADALLSAEAAEKLAPENAQVLSLKGQILEKLGRHTQAQAVLQRYRALLEQQRAQREHQMEGPPDPELLDLPSLQ
jgi:tetratricopeptide (TPR) repeat protein